MAAPLQSRIPLLTLDNGCQVIFEAISATTGLAITGVTVTNVSIYATHDGPGDAALLPEGADWLNLPVEG